MSSEEQQISQGYDALHHTMATDNAVKSNAAEPPLIPGKPVETSTKILDAGRDLLQSFKPIKGIHEHVCGFHFYAHDTTRQVEVHHFCAHPTEELRQCILYDSDAPNARLIGIEYIISERLFKSLPEDEKRYWHSHAQEVRSGTLVAPGVPAVAELQDLQKLAGTYGKTWHCWQIDRGDELPLGPPQLMMGLTPQVGVDPALLQKRDERERISTAQKKKEREGLDYPEKIVEGADCWQSGEAWQVTVEKVGVKRGAIS